MQQFELKRRQLLVILLTELEVALQEQQLWQVERPNDEALASSLPFAIDHLNFTQWLQFIFIEKIALLIEQNLPLPSSMAIAPMASEYFKLQANSCPEIVALITRIDSTINEKA